MNYVNFRQIVKDLKTLQEKHKQINSFGIGDLRQLIYLTQGKTDDSYSTKVNKDNTIENEPPIYPLMYVVPINTTRNENFITYNFNVLICDIMNATNYNIEVDLWSDTLQMAEDILAQYKYSVETSQGDYEARYDLTLPTTITPFSEAYDDILVGWNLSLSLVVDQPLNRCLAPFNEF